MLVQSEAFRCFRLHRGLATRQHLREHGERVFEAQLKSLGTAQPSRRRQRGEHRQVQFFPRALKLHATRTWARAVQGKDYYDILNLIRLHRVDTGATEFREILDRYASVTIRDRLLRDLERDV